MSREMINGIIRTMIHQAAASVAQPKIDYYKINEEPTWNGSGNFTIQHSRYYCGGSFRAVLEAWYDKETESLILYPYHYRDRKTTVSDELLEERLKGKVGWWKGGRISIPLADPESKEKLSQIIKKLFDQHQTDRKPWPTGTNNA